MARRPPSTFRIIKKQEKIRTLEPRIHQRFGAGSFLFTDLTIGKFLTKSDKIKIFEQPYKVIPYHFFYNSTSDILLCNYFYPNRGIIGNLTIKEATQIYNKGIIKSRNNYIDIDISVKKLQDPYPIMFSDNISVSLYAYIDDLTPMPFFLDVSLALTNCPVIFELLKENAIVIKIGNIYTGNNVTTRYKNCVVNRQPAMYFPPSNIMEAMLIVNFYANAYENISVPLIGKKVVNMKHFGIFLTQFLSNYLLTIPYTIYDKSIGIYSEPIICMTNNNKYVIVFRNNYNWIHEKREEFINIFPYFKDENEKNTLLHSKEMAYRYDNFLLLEPPIFAKMIPQNTEYSEIYYNHDQEKLLKENNGICEDIGNLSTLYGKLDIEFDDSSFELITRPYILEIGDIKTHIDIIIYKVKKQNNEKTHKNIGIYSIYNKKSRDNFNKYFNKLIETSEYFQKKPFIIYKSTYNYENDDHILFDINNINNITTIKFELEKNSDGKTIVRLNKENLESELIPINLKLEKNLDLHDLYISEIKNKVYDLLKNNNSVIKIEKTLNCFSVLSSIKAPENKKILFNTNFQINWPIYAFKHYLGKLVSGEYYPVIELSSNHNKIRSELLINILENDNVEKSCYITIINNIINVELDGEIKIFKMKKSIGTKTQVVNISNNILLGDGEILATPLVLVYDSFVIVPILRNGKIKVDNAEIISTIFCDNICIADIYSDDNFIYTYNGNFFIRINKEAKEINNETTELYLPNWKELLDNKNNSEEQKNTNNNGEKQWIIFSSMENISYFIEKFCSKYIPYTEQNDNNNTS